MATCCTFVLVAIWQVAALFWCFYLSGGFGTIQESCRLPGLAQSGGVLGYQPPECKKTPKLLRLFFSSHKVHHCATTTYR